MTKEDIGIVEKLTRTETRKSYLATNRTAPIIENDYQALINPDGPEAAAIITEMVEALEETRRFVDREARQLSNTEEAACKLFDRLSTTLAKVSGK